MAILESKWGRDALPAADDDLMNLPSQEELRSKSLWTLRVTRVLCEHDGLA